MNNEDGRLKDAQGLVLSNQELKYGGLALVFVVFFVFAGGYFLGKKRAYEELAVRYDDECFADKVNQSLSSLYEQGDNEPTESSDAEVENSGEEDACALVPLAESNELQKDAQDETRELAYAQLCGFGTRYMAEAYVSRLQRRAIEATIVERQSRSKKGRMVTWYQVITGTMDKRELEELVKELKKDDKLSGVQIIDARLDESR
jgi:hypothetical protein